MIGFSQTSETISEANFITLECNKRSIRQLANYAQSLPLQRKSFSYVLKKCHPL